MKRALAWFAGLVGIAALGRFLAERHKAKPVPAAPEPADAIDAAGDPGGDPAEELRRKLADSRGGSAPPDDAADRDDEAVEDRRARVHAQARETIDAMADDGGQP